MGHGFVLGHEKGDGVAITVVEGSLAQSAGMRTGDVLVGVGGAYVVSAPTLIVKDPPGAKRDFEIVRGGTTKTITTTAENLLP